MTLRAQVILPYQSNLPRDVATNTFHFDTVSSTPAAAAPIISSRLFDLYNTPVGGGTAICSFISGVIARSLCRIAVYDLDDPMPRAPIWEEGFTLGTAGSSDNLPLELAVCASVQGDRVAGTPQARRRGRVYIGPLKASAVTMSGASVVPQVSSGVITSVNAGIRRLALASGSTAVWVVRSQTTGAVAEITNGWIDNDIDVQRRRGPRATSRTTWTA